MSSIVSRTPVSSWGAIARKTIYDLLNDGEFASVIVGRRRFIPAAAIAAFIGARTTHTAPSEHPAKGRPRTVQMPGLEPPTATRARRRATIPR